MAELNVNSLLSDANLQGYWQLESDGGDSGPNNYDLTAVNTPTFVTGKFGNGADLESGSSQYFTIADGSAPNLEISGSKSFGAWVKPESINAWQYIISKFHNVNQTGARMGIRDSNVFRFQCKGLTTNEAVDGTTAAVAGTWYFVVGVYDSSATKLRIYVNAVKEGEVTASGSSTDSNTAFDIGSNSGDTHLEPFDGIIDDAFVFNRALSDAEILSLYTGISPSASVSPSVSKSPSLSPSVSPSVSLSPSVSPSVSVSPSISPSLSPSISPSISPSVSPSVSLSPSISPSVSVSPSISPSVSESPSIGSSLSPSVSPSVSTSPSISLSPSASPSGSPSTSPSVSASPSLSPSVSPSVSTSPSTSTSPSVSASPSVSPSPSPGFSQYSRGDLGSLPTNRDDLETLYTNDEEQKVSTRNDVRVTQTGALQYMLHQFKDYIGSSNRCSIEWEGQSSLAPGASTVYLQIYNESLGIWETIDYNAEAEADVDFEMCAKIKDLTNYKDGDTVISCRVYQLAT